MNTLTVLPLIGKTAYIMTSFMLENTTTTTKVLNANNPPAINFSNSAKR